jgi:sec-independent protein translocase protein TatC
MSKVHLQPVSILNRLNKNPNKEMTFVDHLESLRWHIIRMVLALIVCAIVAYVNIEWIFQKVVLGPTHKEFPAYAFLCKVGKLIHIQSLCFGDVAISFQANQLSTQFLMGMRSSVVFGFMMACPYIFYELWRFIKPGLSKFELRQSRGILASVTFLFFLGVAFGYFLLTPYAISFFASYQLSPQFQNIFKIDDYLDTVISLSIGAGLLFEIPVVIYFLSKIGFVTPAFLKNTRRYAIVIIFVLAAWITPPDVVSMFIVTIPLILLYEFSIWISGRVEKQRIKAEKEFFST